jgi:SAM-dependent methyltransferase
VKQFHATAERLAGALVEAVRPFLPESGTVLELGSGSGQQVVRLAAAYPRLTWQPSDRDPAALASIAAWCAEAGVGARVRAPLRLDVADSPWPLACADAVLASYLVHVLDEAGRHALFAGAARILQLGGRLLLFGPVAEPAASAAPVEPPAAALRGSVWCPVTQVPTRSALAAAAIRQGLAEAAAAAVSGSRDDGLLLVFRAAG